MIKVLFVCLGNICRSPMAQFILQDKVKKMGLENKFYIDSKATSYEEFGNPPHNGTIKILERYNIEVLPHKSDVIKKSDYSKFDFIIGMNKSNYFDILDIVGEDTDKKVFLLLDFIGCRKDISDPWYTHNFQKTYDDINKGIDGFLNYLKKNKLVV